MPRSFYAGLATFQHATQPQQQRPSSLDAPELPNAWKSKCYTKTRSSIKNVWDFGFYPRTYPAYAVRVATQDKPQRKRPFHCFRETCSGFAAQVSATTAVVGDLTNMRKFHYPGERF
jgi:hypothetical protein